MYQATLFCVESLVSKCTRNPFAVKSFYVIFKMSSDSDSDEFDFEFVSKAAKRTQGTCQDRSVHEGVGE